MSITPTVMSNLCSTQTQYQVVCICGGHGFPLGTASAARITMVGKALREAGLGFRLFHCGPSPVAINTRRSGVYEGIPFEYTTPVRRPQNRLVRSLMYLWGAFGLAIRLARLWPARRETLVYLYVMKSPLNLYVGWICRILGLPIVQELCEWFPGEATCSAFTKWLHRKSMFKLATGVLVISKTIEQRVKERAAEVNPDLVVQRVPAIVDVYRFAATSPAIANGAEQPVPNFVYCGTWLKDVLFLIRMFVSVRLDGYRCKLTIVGNCGHHSRPIMEYAMEKGLSAEDIVLAGCVDERALEACYKGAIALLMPLWDDDQSVTRMPNKLGEYLASGRPVIGCKIGDLTDFLADNVNAYLAETGNERDFADRMIAVLQNPERAGQIGAAGQKAAIAHLDYRGYISGLAQFFARCSDYHRNRHSTRRNTVKCRAAI